MKDKPGYTELRRFLIKKTKEIKGKDLIPAGFVLIPEYEDKYAVNEHGDIWSLLTNQILVMSGSNGQTRGGGCTPYVLGEKLSLTRKQAKQLYKRIIGGAKTLYQAIQIKD